jgi:hypothetical protein
LRLKASIPKSNPVVVLPPPHPPLGPGLVLHCPGHLHTLHTGTTRTNKIDRLARPTPDSPQKPSWKATSAPVTISFLRYCGPGQVPCHSLSSLVFPCHAVCRRPPLGLPASSFREPYSPWFPNIRPQHPEPSCQKPDRPVARHPSSFAWAQPLLSHLPRHNAAGCFAIYTIPCPINRSRGSSRLLSSTLANAFGEPF